MKIIKKTINGIEYVAEWKGVSFSKERIESCRVKNTEMLSKSKLAKVVFNEVITSPKISANDFSDFNEFEEVLDFGASVLFGEFDKKSDSQLKREVEQDWGAYRLIFCDMANYTEDYVFNEMTPAEIKKANIALDMIQEAIKRQTKSKK